MSTEDYIGLGLLAIAGLAVLLLSVYLKLRALARAFKSLHARLLACECELRQLKTTNDGVRGLGRN